MNFNDQRLTTFPLKDLEAWGFYKKAVSAFWVVEEIDFSEDRKDFETLTESEQRLIEMVLAFFAVSDGLVSENLEDNFINHPSNSLETNYFFAFQDTIENIHAETYSTQIENIIREPERKATLFNAIKNFPSIQQKTTWIVKFMDSELPFVKRLLAFVIVEGVYFSSSFSTIFFFKRKGLMKGLTFSNELISKDEGLHTQFGIFMFKRHNITNPLSKDEVHGIMNEAVAIEKAFAKECFLVGTIKGLLVKDMFSYIEFVANSLLKSLGYELLFDDLPCPFAFMIQINLPGKTNFFENNVSDYQNANVMYDNELDFSKIKI
jgi:ribonucleotide reductase beta subunit family protein with ferritin-like domain